MNRRLDPAACLNEECMLSVLSFVGGNFARQKNYASGFVGDLITRTKEESPPKWKQQSSAPSSQEIIMDEMDTFLSVVEAAKFYRTIALVCCKWKKLMDASFTSLATNIEVDFEEIGAKTKQVVYECILWLCQHHKTLQIGSIKTRSQVKATLNDLSLLIHLLQECDTENVSNYQVQMIGDSFSKCQPLGSPFLATAVETCQRELQEAIALNCPKLRTLGLSLVIQEHGGRDIPEVIGQSLYSLPSITSLDITVEMDERRGTLGCMFFSRLIENLTTLTHLSLRSNRTHFMESVFHIQSSSLKQLHVEDFSKQAMLTLDCPNLEAFRCKGGFFGNTNPQILSVHQKVVRAQNIPTSCCASVVNVCNPHAPPTEIKFHNVLDPSVGFLPPRSPHPAWISN